MPLIKRETLGMTPMEGYDTRHNWSQSMGEYQYRAIGSYDLVPSDTPSHLDRGRRL